jgi:hypothetical protein
MAKQGYFNIPETTHQSTDGARRAYRAMWNRDWPEDDAFLRELARETKGQPQRCRLLLDLMRENHVFEPDPA